MKDLKPIIKESIEHFCKAPSLQQLHHLCCQFYQKRPKDSDVPLSDQETLAPPAGDDGREEIQIVIDAIKGHSGTSGTYPNTLKQLEQNMNSVVLIVRKSDLTEGDGVEVPKDKYIIRSQKLKDRKIHLQNHIHKIHPRSRYANQHSADSLGTGFFIMPRVIVTAAHVLNPSFYDLVLTPGEHTDSDKEVRFITDVKISAADKMENGIIVAKENVYKPVAEKASHWASLGEDWSIIEVQKEDETFPLERQVVGYNTKPVAGNEIYCIGHGFGLPMKISLEGKIMDIGDGYFDCNLDVFSGNSGSPVFDAHTHEAIGILIRGDRNFVFSEAKDSKGKRFLKPSTASGFGDQEECQTIMPVVNVLKKLYEVSV